MVPEHDYFYGENRNAFPVDVPAGEKTAAWIDVFVPRRQRRGTYRGSVMVHDADGLVAEVPLTITVRRFAIPSTTRLTSSFGSWNRSAGRTPRSGLRGRPTVRWLLHALYARAGLENRITLSDAIPLATKAPLTGGPAALVCPLPWFP